MAAYIQDGDRGKLFSIGDGVFADTMSPLMCLRKVLMPSLLSVTIATQAQEQVSSGSAAYALQDDVNLYRSYSPLSVEWNNYTKPRDNEHSAALQPIVQKLVDSTRSCAEQMKKPVHGAPIRPRRVLGCRPSHRNAGFSPVIGCGVHC